MSWSRFTSLFALQALPEGASHGIAAGVATALAVPVIIISAQGQAFSQATTDAPAVAIVEAQGTAAGTSSGSAVYADPRLRPVTGAAAGGATAAATSQQIIARSGLSRGTSRIPLPGSGGSADDTLESVDSTNSSADQTQGGGGEEFATWIIASGSVVSPAVGTSTGGSTAVGQIVRVRVSYGSAGGSSTVVGRPPQLASAFGAAMAGSTAVAVGYAYTGEVAVVPRFRTAYVFPQDRTVRA